MHAPGTGPCLDTCTGPEGDYAFFGDGAWFAYALTPVARYQPSLARALGKWLLSLSANSRLYWPDALPDDQQCNPGDPRDPNGTLPYEASARARESPPAGTARRLVSCHTEPTRARTVAPWLRSSTDLKECSVG